MGKIQKIFDYNNKIMRNKSPLKNTSCYLTNLILSIGIFLSLIIYPVIFVSQNSLFYQYHLSNNENISLIELDDALRTSKRITGFLQTAKNLPVEKMTERAVIHMLDVKDIYQRAIALPIIILIFGLLLSISVGTKISSKSILAASLSALAFYTILAVSGDKLFRFLFINFHFLLYTNDLWMLDANDLLIKLYPEYFFSRLFTISGSITIIAAVITIVVLITIKKYANRFSNR